MANAFYGSALMIGMATAFSVPIGLLTAIYLAEYRSGRIGAVVRFKTSLQSNSCKRINFGFPFYKSQLVPYTGLCLQEEQDGNQ